MCRTFAASHAAINLYFNAKNRQQDTRRSTQQQGCRWWQQERSSHPWECQLKHSTSWEPASNVHARQAMLQLWARPSWKLGLPGLVVSLRQRLIDMTEYYTFHHSAQTGTHAKYWPTHPVCHHRNHVIIFTHHKIPRRGLLHSAFLFILVFIYICIPQQRACMAFCIPQSSLSPPTWCAYIHCATWTAAYIIFTVGWRVGFYFANSSIVASGFL
jgi:hypothetical protein